MLHSPSIIFVVHRRFASRLVCWSRNSAEGGAVFCKVEDDCVEVCECGSGGDSQTRESLSQSVAQIAGKIRNKKLSRSERKEDESDVVQERKKGTKGVQEGKNNGQDFLMGMLVQYNIKRKRTKGVECIIQMKRILVAFYAL